MKEEIKKEVYEWNNPEDIQEIHIELSSDDKEVMATVVVTDSDGKTTNKIVKIISEPNTIPSIKVTDKVVKVGDDFNPLNGVKASDIEDGDITDKIEVVENNIDTTKEGEYKLVYSVTDSCGKSVTKEIKVIVEEKSVVSKPSNDNNDEGNSLSKPNLPETGGSNSAFALSGALTSIFSGMFIGKKKRR